MRRFVLCAGTAIVTLASIITGANAQQPERVQVGVLECRGGASVGFIVGSVTHLGCVLRVEGRPEDRYIATIQKVGLDIGITEETALAWGVWSVRKDGPRSWAVPRVLFAGPSFASASTAALRMTWTV